MDITENIRIMLVKMIHSARDQLWQSGDSGMDLLQITGNVFRLLILFTGKILTHDIDGSGGSCCRWESRVVSSNIWAQGVGCLSTRYHRVPNIDVSMAECIIYGAKRILLNQLHSWPGRGEDMTPSSPAGLMKRMHYLNQPPSSPLQNVTHCCDHFETFLCVSEVLPARYPRELSGRC